MPDSIYPGAVVWIIGASTGIGRALSLALSAEGATVIASARRGDLLEALVREAPGPGRVIAMPLDAQDTAAVVKAAQDIEADIGPIDLALYGAAAWTASKREPLTAAEFAAKFDVNVMGAVRMLEAVLPPMRARGRGHVAVISSVAGYRGLPRAAAYGASKAALINLCESLRLTVARDGVKVQVINPGFVETPLTAQNDFPMPFLIDAGKAARYTLAGLRAGRFEITYPKRFTYMLKLLRILPYPVYFWLLSRVAG